MSQETKDKILAILAWIAALGGAVVFFYLTLTLKEPLSFDKIQILFLAIVVGCFTAGFVFWFRPKDPPSK